MSSSAKELGLPRDVLTAVLREAIASGNISFKKKAPGKIKGEIKQNLRLITTGAVTIVPILDHTDDLLRLARVSMRESKWNFAVLLYATYFEHVVNSFLFSQANRRRLTKATLTQMIREVNFAGKTGWLLEVLGMKPLNPRHRQRLIKLSEIRNGFVHYKWLPRVDGELDPAMQCLKDVEKIVSYLRRYEERMFYDGQRSRLTKAALKLSQGD
jgi:hypothetical protein